MNAIDSVNAYIEQVNEGALEGAIKGLNEGYHLAHNFWSIRTSLLITEIGLRLIGGTMVIVVTGKKLPSI